MMTVGGVEPAWVWLIFGVVLAILEIVIPGSFLMWIGFAAILTGALTALTGMSDPAQFGSFAVLSILSVYLGRRWFVRHPIATTDPMLNIRAARLVGQTVTVVEAISGGRGRVRVGDGVWSAQGPDAEAGERLRVSGVDGIVLRVERLAVSEFE